MAEKNLSKYVFLVLVFFTKSASAQEIYQWQDSSGRTHYSNSPTHSSAERKKLPQVSRENIDEKIRQLKLKTPPNCGAHGGIDCQAGADKDGSVICTDGFKDALLPFRFSCLEAKLQAQFALQVVDKSMVLHASKEAKQLLPEAVQAFVLSVRNISDTAALNVSVTFLVNGKRPLIAKGPDKVEAFANADYILPLTDLSLAPGISEIARTTFQLKCANCAGVLTGK